jgi:hypothetical protein
MEASAYHDIGRARSAKVRIGSMQQMRVQLEGRDTPQQWEENANGEDVRVRTGKGQKRAKRVNVEY